MTVKKETKTSENIKIEKKTDTTKKSVSNAKQEQNNTNDMFSPENMAKMFAMFKQFENMEQMQKLEKQETIKKEDMSKNEKFTKVMLTKIGDEIITVRSAVDNVSFISPKTKVEYNWLAKGDVEPLTINEILAMENKSKRFLHTPWLIIEDDRVVQALNLQRTYDLIEKVENVDELITLSKDEITKIFNELPSKYKNNFRNEIYRKIKTRELNNLSTIDDLSEILHIDLNTI